MDKDTFADITERLLDINAVIVDLDESVRAPAFEFLRPYITDQYPWLPGGSQSAPSGGSAPDAGSATAFVRSQGIDDPADAVRAIAAWWFSQYGAAPIRRTDIETIAAEIGATVSNRPDKTLKEMRAGGKVVFRAAREGGYVPTVPHGELFFEHEYRVAKGTKTAPPSASGPT